MAKQMVIIGDTGQQLVDKLANNFTELYSRPAQGEPGAGGKSAYDIAVEHGFIGDEATWLASLHGTNGKDGAGIPEEGLPTEAIKPNPFDDVRVISSQGYGAPGWTPLSILLPTPDSGSSSGGTSGGSSSNVEYIYNYNASEYDDYSSCTTGADGAFFPNSQNFSNISKRVEASKDLTGAKCTIECSLGYEIWQDVAAVGYGFVRDSVDKNGLPSNLQYGIALEYCYGSVLNVQFKSGGAYPSNGAGANGCEWSGLHAQGYKWRVRVEYTQ